MNTSDAIPNNAPGGNASATDERRVNLHVRAIFDDACRITEPFFDSVNGWGSSSLTMYARQTLRENYPELTQQDVAILFSAIQCRFTIRK